METENSKESTAASKNCEIYEIQLLESDWHSL
jgi:hypothetical protein